MAVPPSRSTEPVEETEEYLRSRSDARTERKRAEDELMTLAADLVELNDRSLGRLDLPELVLRTVQDARAIKAMAARNRAMRLVRAALRDSDLALIRKRFRQMVDPRAAVRPPAFPAQWDPKLGIHVT